MSDQQTEKSKTFQLPNQLAGSSDLARLIRELERLDDALYQSQIRTPGASVNLPKSSHVLEAIASTNHYSLLDQEHRTRLLNGLRQLDKSAPTIHISFAVEPSSKFVEKIVAWMREHLHQYLLVEVGLQPSIAVGCVVRTNNKIFDMSLRHRFSEYRSVLAEKIAENPHQKDAVEQPKQPTETKAEVEG